MARAEGFPCSKALFGVNGLKVEIGKYGLIHIQTRTLRTYRFCCSAAECLVWLKTLSLIQRKTCVKALTQFLLSLCARFFAAYKLAFELFEFLLGYNTLREQVGELG
jgi:hypothetical protein